MLSGYAGHVEWLGLDDALEEVHEFFANTAMSLVIAHLALIALLSVVRQRNLAAPMLTGRTPGPGRDLVKANRVWLAVLVVAVISGLLMLGIQESARVNAHGGPYEGLDRYEARIVWLLPLAVMLAAMPTPRWR